jgi:hypothetical protein
VADYRDLQCPRRHQAAALSFCHGYFLDFVLRDCAALGGWLNMLKPPDGCWPKIEPPLGCPPKRLGDVLEDAPNMLPPEQISRII